MIKMNEQHATDDGSYKGPVLPLSVYLNLLKEVEAIGATHFYDRAKSSGEETIPFQRAIEEIEHTRPSAHRKYDITIQDRARQALALLPVTAYDTVKNALLELIVSPSASGQKLKERNGWRIEAGDYVVIFEIDDPQKIITILHVGHRNEVYRLPVPNDSKEYIDAPH
jgi:mRNA interferase RelE/StbE